MCKKVVSCVILFAILIVSSVDIYATEQRDTFTEWECSLLEKDRLLRDDPINNALMVEREIELEEFLRQERVQRNTLLYKVIAVPVIQQMYDYYCGSATAKQVIDFRNGIPRAQDQLADELRTNINRSSDMHDAHVTNRVAPHGGRVSW